MDYALIASDRANGNGTDTMPFGSFTCAVGDKIRVWVDGTESAGVVSVSDGTANDYELVASADATFDAHLRVLDCDVAHVVSGGTLTIQTDFGILSAAGYQRFDRVGALQYEGSLEQDMSATPGTDQISLAALPTAQPAMIWALTASNNQDPASAAGSGFTDRGINAAEDAHAVRLEDRLVTSAAATVATFTSVSFNTFMTIVLVHSEGDAPPPSSDDYISFIG